MVRTISQPSGLHQVGGKKLWCTNVFTWWNTGNSCSILCNLEINSYGIKYWFNWQSTMFIFFIFFTPVDPVKKNLKLFRNYWNYILAFDFSFPHSSVLSLPPSFSLSWLSWEDFNFLCNIPFPILHNNYYIKYTITRRCIFPPWKLFLWILAKVSHCMSSSLPAKRKVSKILKRERERNIKKKRTTVYYVDQSNIKIFLVVFSQTILRIFTPQNECVFHVQVTNWFKQQF